LSEVLQTEQVRPEEAVPSAPVHSAHKVPKRLDPEYSHDGIFTAVRNILETIVVTIFIITFAVQPSRIPSESMQPTLKVGDFLLVDKQTFAPAGFLDKLLLPKAKLQRGDLVVFHYPVDGNVTLVKRVIGLPGDRIRLHLGRVLINDAPLAEPYAMYTPSKANNYRDEFPSQREFPEENVQTAWWLRLRTIVSDGEITVPPGNYFVLGDNRNDSEDSRYWGFVPQDEIIGRPLLVYFTARAEEATGTLGRLRAAWYSFHVPR
jgi:signal peptidase I